MRLTVAVVLQNSSYRCLLTLATLPAVNYQDVAFEVYEVNLVNLSTFIKQLVFLEKLNIKHIQYVRVDEKVKFCITLSRCWSWSSLG